MMLLKILQDLNRQDFHPSVISLGIKGEIGQRIESLGVPVYAFQFGLGWTILPKFFRLFSLVCKLRPNLIQGWMLHGNLLASILGLVFRCNVVWGVRHSSLPKDENRGSTIFISNFLGLISFLPKKIIYNSLAGRLHHEDNGYSIRKSLVIPNGFDTTLFAPNLESRNQLRSALGLQSDALLIGLVARYHPMKGHKIYLNAASLLAKSYPDIKFILIGEGCDESNCFISDLIKSNNIQNNVILLGLRNDVFEITSALDIAVSSSVSSEGFPNTLGEAMSCGIPCVVTNVGDSAWIVGDTGVIVEAESPDDLAKGCLKLIELGEVGRNNLGSQARRRIVSDFSIQSVIRQYESLYRKVINE